MHTLNKGFTIFFATLVTSLALAIGLAIYDLTARELNLSATVNQSQYAIYAADSGAECALYWDTRCQAGSCFAGSAFATSTWGGATVGAGLNCNSGDITTLNPPDGTPGSWSVSQSPGSQSATTTFTVTFTGAPYCATVTVAKRGIPDKTTVVAHGYNTCVPGAPGQLERALQVSY